MLKPVAQPPLTPLPWLMGWGGGEESGGPEGSLSSSLCIEVVYESLHVHPVYKTVDVYISEAFEHHHWDPKHGDCNGSHERRIFQISAPLVQ